MFSSMQRPTHCSRVVKEHLWSSNPVVYSGSAMIGIEKEPNVLMTKQPQNGAFLFLDLVLINIF